MFTEELGVSRDTGDSGTNLADILSNVLPQSSTDLKLKEKSSDSSVSKILCSEWNTSKRNNPFSKHTVYLVSQTVPSKKCLSKRLKTNMYINRLFSQI